VNAVLQLEPSSSPRLSQACARLGDAAPATLTAIGDPALLENPNLTALLCSHRLPGDLILPAYDLARALRAEGVPVIGGFHAPMEREALRLLMRGEQPIIHVPARGLEGMRLTKEQRTAIDAGRLLLLSPFDARESRLTAPLAAQRNRLVGALADRVLIIHASPGGQVEALCRTFLSWAKPVYALPGEGNAHLFAAGVEAWGVADIHIDVQGRRVQR